MYLNDANMRMYANDTNGNTLVHFIRFIRMSSLIRTALYA